MTNTQKVRYYKMAAKLFEDRKSFQDNFGPVKENETGKWKILGTNELQRGAFKT